MQDRFCVARTVCLAKKKVVDPYSGIEIPKAPLHICAHGLLHLEYGFMQLPQSLCLATVLRLEGKDPRSPQTRACSYLGNHEDRWRFCIAERSCPINGLLCHIRVLISQEPCCKTTRAAVGYRRHQSDHRCSIRHQRPVTSAFIGSCTSPSRRRYLSFISTFRHRRLPR